MNTRYLMSITLVFLPLFACGTSSGTAGTGGGKACPNGNECTNEEMCSLADGACGTVDKTKKCFYFAPTCGEDPPATVCGCDGKTHSATCALFGDEDLRAGACPPPAGKFWCGDISCALGQDYCHLDMTAACQPLPVACMGASTDCGCLAPLPVGCACAKKADGHLEVGCPMF